MTTFTYLRVVACTSPDIEDVEICLDPSVSKSIDARALGRYALSNLYITNPNPDLPLVLHSSIKIPGYKEKTIVPSLQLLV